MQKDKLLFYNLIMKRIQSESLTIELTLFIYIRVPDIFMDMNFMLKQWPHTFIFAYRVKFIYVHEIFKSSNQHCRRKIIKHLFFHLFWVVLIIICIFSLLL